MMVTILTDTTGGQLLSRLRRPWRDGSTALLLYPLELLERLLRSSLMSQGTVYVGGNRRRGG